MTEPLSDVDRDAVLRFLTQLRENPPPNFTPKQAEALREFSDVWIGMITVGRFAKGGFFVLRWVGWLVALYLAYRSGVWDMVLKVIGGVPH